MYSRTERKWDVWGLKMTGAARRANRMGAAFESSPEEGYYGFGERYDTS